MSSDPRRREAAVLQAMLPSLQTEGFEVFLKPDRFVLPPFLHGAHPDAIATKPGRKLVIEVVSQGERDRARVAELQGMMAGHADWEFRVVFAPSEPLPPAPPVASEEVVRAALSRVPAIHDAAGPIPALLTVWSAFEAAARLVVPGDATWGMSPSSLVEWLTQRGTITNQEADIARPLARLRNEAAHGGLDRVAAREEVDALAKVVLVMLSEHDGAAAA